MENEKKNRKAKIAVACGVGILGTVFIVGYKMGKSRANSIAHNRWVDVAHEVAENGSKILMVPDGDGMATYLKLSIPSEDYDSTFREFFEGMLLV